MNVYEPDDGKTIDRYIRDNPSCIIPKIVSVVLTGKSKNLQTYCIPLSMTFYNIKNGRFAAEYAHLKKELSRELDPRTIEDSKHIQKLLIELDPKQSLALQNDIQQYKQREPGIITHDGKIINGNRRRSVLENLVSIGQRDFEFIQVARLPPNISAKDLWKIEANIQLSRNVQLDYGSINILLKFQQGINSGLTPADIADSLFNGKEKEIREKLEQLKLIVEYLQFIDESGNYNKIKGIYEHFIDLNNILKDFKKFNSDIYDSVIVKQIGFQIIHDGVHQWDIRKMKNMLRNEKIKSQLWPIKEFCRPEKQGVKKDKKYNADKHDEFTVPRTIFNNCIDSIKALDGSKEPKKLLDKAFINLDSIDITTKSLHQPEISELIIKIEKTIVRLKNSLNL